LRVLLSGSSGFIGSEVFSYFHQLGAEVVCLKRGDPSRSSSHTIFWEPNHKQFHLPSFEGFDAVIHLAGEPIVGRWSEAKRARILESRIVSTNLLAEIFSRVDQPPAVFLSASAVGYYGDRGEEWLTEKSSPGEGFLASVCIAWEGSAKVLEHRGVRVVHTRFGAVIGKEGGILKKMILPFKLGLGCTLGSGKQWMSWIALKDLVRAIAFCIETASIEGPVNCVSPNPIRQREFAKCLAASLSRPLFFQIPAWFLRTILGQMGDEVLLASQRVSPEKLHKNHFSFQAPTLEEAISL